MFRRLKERGKSWIYDSRDIAWTTICILNLKSFSNALTISLDNVENFLTIVVYYSVMSVVPWPNLLTLCIEQYWTSRSRFCDRAWAESFWAIFWHARELRKMLRDRPDELKNTVNSWKINKCSVAKNLFNNVQWRWWSPSNLSVDDTTKLINTGHDIKRWSNALNILGWTNFQRFSMNMFEWNNLVNNLI